MQRLTAGAPRTPVSRYLAALPRAADVDFAPLIGAVRGRRPTRRRCTARARRGTRGAQRRAVAASLSWSPRSLAAERAGDPAGIRPQRRCARGRRIPRRLQSPIIGARRSPAVSYSRSMSCWRPESKTRISPPPSRPLIYNRISRGCAGARRSSLPPRPPSCRRRERAQLRHLLILAALGAKTFESPAAVRQIRDVRLRDLYLAWITARRAARLR